MGSSDDVKSGAAAGADGADARRGTPGGSTGASARKSERPSMRPGGPASLIGMTLSGRYKIERIIGEGGIQTIVSGTWDCCRMDIGCIC